MVFGLVGVNWLVDSWVCLFLNRLLLLLLFLVCGLLCLFIMVFWVLWSIRKWRCCCVCWVCRLE